MVTSGLHACVHTHMALKFVLLMVCLHFCLLLPCLVPELESIVINRMGEGREKERNEGQKGKR